MPFKVGPMELIIALVIVMMIFGVGRLPQVGNSLGKAVRDFRHALSQKDGSEIAENPSSSHGSESERSRDR